MFGTFTGSIGQQQRANTTCLVCGYVGYVGKHLQKSDDCRREYARSLGLEENANVQEIMKKRRNETRKGNASRSKENRRLESDNDGLKTFRKQSSEPKWIYSCFVCERINLKINLDGIVRQEEHEDIHESFERESLLWRCKSCKKKPEIGLERWILMGKVQIENKIIAIPKISNDHHPVQNLYCTHLLLPSSVAALSRIKGMPEPENREDIIYTIQTTPGDLDFENFAAGAVELQTKKIWDCKQFCSAPRGKIIHKSQRQIALSKPFVHTAKIKGTDDYYDRLERDLKFTAFQEGNIFLKVVAELPKKTDTCLTTALMQMNSNHIEIQNITDEDGIKKVKYWVHPHPNRSDVCPYDCSLVMDVNTFAEKTFSEAGYVPDWVSTGPFLTSSVSYIRSQKTQLHKLLVKTFQPSRHFSSIQFKNECSDAELVACMWPACLNDIQKKMARKEKLKEEDKTRLTEWFDSKVTASMKEDKINLLVNSNGDGKEAANLAKELQYDINGSKYTLSNISMIKEKPTPPIGEHWGPVDMMTMVDKYSQVETEFDRLLDNLSDDHFGCDSDLTLDSFLLDLQNSEDFFLERSPSFYKIKLPGSEPVKLIIDQVLLNIIETYNFCDLSAIYHRAISMTDDTNLEVVLKRSELRERFTAHYNPQLLLAAKAKTSVDLIIVNNDTKMRDLVCANNTMPEVLNEFSVDFSLVSMEKALWILNPLCKLIIRDSKPLYVSTSTKPTHNFREARVPSAQNYTNIADGKEYELSRSIYDMYLDRIGFEKLPFKQVLAYYDKAGAQEQNEDEEQEIEELTAQEKIYVACSNDDNEFAEELPAVLLTKSGEKLLRRDKARIITHQTPVFGSEEFMFLNVVLYHPHSSEDEVNVQKKILKDIFDKKDLDPEKDGEGKVLSKIETVRGRVHPRLNPELWNLFHQ